MSRWHGPGKNTTKGYYWRNVECHYCGKRYRDFRIWHYYPWYQGVDMWEECKMELRLEREPPGSDEPPDPNRPVNRRAVLGRMFQYKQEGWKKHVEKCEEYYEMSIYVNNFTGHKRRLVGIDNKSGDVETYILEDDEGNTQGWSKVHFERCWKPLVGDE